MLINGGAWSVFAMGIVTVTDGNLKIENGKKKNGEVGEEKNSLLTFNLKPMALEEKIAKIFHLTGDNWLKHANPWSVWTRFATLPFLVLAIWSRVWIDWYSVIPIGIIVVWLIFNPILFKKPKSFDSWAAKSVIGEKYWSQRKKKAVPQHHHVMITILTVLQSLGSIILLIGLWRLDIHITILGMVTVYLSKMWFLDRMVWIYGEMTEG